MVPATKKKSSRCVVVIVGIIRLDEVNSNPGWEWWRFTFLKRSFFQAAVVSILLYECITWTQTKRLKKKLDDQLHKNVASNIEQVLAATPHKALTIRPPASRHEKLSKLDEADVQDPTGEARTNSSEMYSYGPPHMAKQKQNDQLEHIYSSDVRIWDVALKTCQRWWMIGRSGDRGSGYPCWRHDMMMMMMMMIVK